MAGPRRERPEERDRFQAWLLEEIVADADPPEVSRALGVRRRVEQLLGREEAEENAAVGQAQVEAGRDGQRAMLAVRKRSRKPRP